MIIFFFTSIITNEMGTQYSSDPTNRVTVHEVSTRRLQSRGKDGKSLDYDVVGVKSLDFSFPVSGTYDEVNSTGNQDRN